MKAPPPIECTCNLCRGEVQADADHAVPALDLGQPALAPKLEVEAMRTACGNPHDVPHSAKIATALLFKPLLSRSGLPTHAFLRKAAMMLWNALETVFWTSAGSMDAAYIKAVGDLHFLESRTYIYDSIDGLRNAFDNPSRNAQ